MHLHTLSALSVLCLLMAGSACADPPHISYIFPAGGQRGTKFEFQVGGHNLHESASFRTSGKGLNASGTIKRASTLWFEGPVIEQPASQQKEDYPKDYAGLMEIAADAPLGFHHWSVATSQGVTTRMKFVVGTLPEIREQEIDGDPIPFRIQIPVTINGRIFPREDVDVWTFEAMRDETISCEVMAARLGSQLDSRLEIRSPDGRVLAQNVDALGTDSFVRFKAPADGIYECRIHDINFGGLQHFVYRLSIRRGPSLDWIFPAGGQRGTTIQAQLIGTELRQPAVPIDLPDTAQDFLYWHPEGSSTRAVPLAISDLPEAVESEPNDSQDLPDTLIPARIPSVLNGRIGQPGDIDLWPIQATPDTTVQFEVFAARHGTDLDSVIRVVDGTGKQLATSDDLKSGVTDSKLIWKVPQEGPWFLEIRDQLPSRGGNRFAYRVQVTDVSAPDFALVLPQDSLNIDRGGEAKLKLNVERSGYTGQISLTVEGLPAGVTVEGTQINANKTSTQLVFKATEAAKLVVADVTITGTTAEVKPELVRKARMPVPFGDPSIDHITVAVALPTPFRFRAPFETKYAARGTTFTRHYFLDRNGFQGPIEISLADRQVRHLQGVTGRTVLVPPGESEFDYTVTLPSWMKIGRTSRTTLVASGFVDESNGTRHRVSYSSQAQDDQIIILVDPVRLSLDTTRKSIGIRPGTTAALPIQVRRGPGLTGPVTVHVRAARHIGGWNARPVRVAAGDDLANLEIEFGASPGPFNMPLIVTGWMQDERGQPVTFEMPIRVRRLD